jgi:environmental stress-induced protein Ves
LQDGPVRDFNLMVRRGRATGAVVIARGAGVRIAPARFRLCYSAHGASECLFGGHPPLTVATDHALLVVDEPATSTPLAVNPLSGDAVTIVVRVDLVA